MNIYIKIIPHAEQRYDTVGDWYYVGDDLHIRVSKMSDWRFEQLVVQHEYNEAILCEHDGITQKQVDDFDMEFEKTRTPGDESEPGDNPQAPYRRQHFFATNTERQLADRLGVDWKDYEAELASLP